jgi:hypothetical protein
MPRIYKMSIDKIEKSIKTFIKELFPKIEEEPKYGGILYNAEGYEYFCGVFSYKKHVTIEFSFGYQLKDPKNLLQGSGKYRRNLKFKNEDEISFTELKKFLKEAQKLSKL